MSSENVFSVLLSGTQVANPKPAPDIFLETAKLLSVFSEDKLEIADSISSFVEEEATANKIPWLYKSEMSVLIPGMIQ